MFLQGKRRAWWWLVALVGVWAVVLGGVLAWGDPTTHALPDEGRQRQQMHGDLVHAGYAVSGCLPTTSASLTLSAFACEGWVKDTSTGELVWSYQASTTLGPVSGTSPSWVLLRADTSTVPASWTCKTGSRYCHRQSATQPANPTKGLLMAKLTVAAGAITAVTDLRPPASFARHGVYDVTDPLYGAVGDGTTDDAAAFVAALAAGTGKRVLVPAPVSAYKIGSALTIPDNTWLVGVGQRLSKIQHAFNGDLFTLKDGAGLEGLYLEGDGNTYSGQALVLGGTDGRQVVQDCRIINFQGAIFAIATAAGSQMSVSNVVMNRWNIATHAAAATGSGLYAVVIDPTQQLSAVPRKFSHIETNGCPAFDFGGSNDTYLSNAFVGDLLFNTESRGVHVVNTRWANQTAATLSGHNNTLVGNGIAPQLTIAAASDDWHISGNSLNTPPIIDNSLTGRNQLEHIPVTYTPIWSATAGTVLDVGNGTLRGQYTRVGNLITASIELTIGGTTVVGSAGVWTFTLPADYYGALTVSVQLGSGYAYDTSSSTVALVVPSVVAGNRLLYMNLSGTGGQMTYNQPWAWAAGDFVRLTITYQTE